MSNVMGALLVGLAMGSGGAFGQEEPGTDPLQNEAQEEFERMDGELRAVYGTLLEMLTVEERQALELVQGKWAEFRTEAARSVAELSSPVEGFRPLLEFYELRRLTEERMEALQRVVGARQAVDRGGAVVPGTP